MTLLRVFPSRTRATPRDDYVRFDVPVPDEDLSGIEEIHISATFTWDKDKAFRLFEAWEQAHENVKIGGPALGDHGDEFVPGRYLAKGNVITSRGCPNRCIYCMAREREGDIRELPVRDGWKIHDNNLLACSRPHIERVCEMLLSQSGRPVLAGGLEARRFMGWHARAFRRAKVDRMYFANDRPGDIMAVERVAILCREVGFTRSHHLYCYVLIGFSGDTLEDAEERLRATWRAGMVPYAMLWRGEDGGIPSEKWKTFQRLWVRPAIIKTRMKAIAQNPQICISLPNDVS